MSGGAAPTENGGASGSPSGGAPGGGGGVSSGGGGTAGTSSAGGASGSGASVGCSPDYLLCEDFEATAVGKVPTGWTAHGQAAVDEDQAKGGKHSLKVQPAKNGERRIYHDAKVATGTHWGRVNFRVLLPVPGPFVHSTLVAFSGKGPTTGDGEFRVVDTVKDATTGGFANGNYQFIYNVQPANGAEFGTSTNYDYTFDDKWHCTEWQVDAATQSFHFYYDGKEINHITNGAGKYAGTDLPTTFSDVRVGWNNYQEAAPGFTAWLDDFVIDDQRVGCAP